MRCLCCGKVIKETATMEEKENSWHNRCVKSFFGTKKMPRLDISNSQMEKIADTMVNHGLTIPGVQKKLLLHLSTEQDSRLTIVDYPTGYILKPQTDEYANLPEFEELSMQMAEICGIKTVPHALIKMNHQYAYITKRIDRIIRKNEVELFAMEDFCQLAGRLTQDKYKGAYEACGRIIKKYSVHPGLDMSELFLRVVFSFVTGNSDMHLKNFSLIVTEPANRDFELSNAYDMLPVNVVLPEDIDQMALTLNGKKRNIRKKDFREFAEKCDINERAAEGMIRSLCSMQSKLLEACDASYLPQESIERTKTIIVSRIEVLNH